MNWLIKFSKNILILILGIFVFLPMAYSDVITGEIRHEHDVSKNEIETPNIEPHYSVGSIMAYNAGIQYYYMQDYDKAIKSFISAIDQEPKFADAYFNLGLLYYNFDKPSDALISFYRAYLNNKKDDEALFYMIKCYVDKGDKIAARYYARKISKKSEFYSKTQEVLK